MGGIDAARKYIEDIRNRHISSDREFVLDSLTGAINRLEKAFPRYGSFLMEFIQNADDARSESLKIEIAGNTIGISNDGDLFSEEDVKSICKVGRSAKAPKDYIGYLGVGFKSVFLISECPEIYSGHFRFRFARNDWPDPDHIPWQIIPLWIDNPQTEFPEKCGTVFRISLKETNLLELLRAEIRAEHLSNRMLLFLRNVKRIEIIDSSVGFKREIAKCELSRAPDYEIHQIQECAKDLPKTYERWLVFRSLCTVPEEVKEDYMTKEWERENIDKREILVAFRLGKDDELAVERKGTAHIGVFSFLPLKELPSGLNFLIQADFLTTPGRGELARECLWNNWLADEIRSLLIHKSIPTFLKHEKWRMGLAEVLYSSEGGHELFEHHIKEPLREHLENNAVLIAEDGSATRAVELVHIDEEIKGLLTKADLQMLFPGKKIINKECMSHVKPYLHHNLYSKIEKAPNDIYRFLASPISDELIESKAKKGNIIWFRRVYSMLVDKYEWEGYFKKKYAHYNVEHDSFWNRVRNLDKPIILTQDCSLAKISESYTNPEGFKIPQQIKDKFRIVHPEVVKDAKFDTFLKRLNEDRYHGRRPEREVITALTEDDVANALAKQNAAQLNEEKWRRLPDSSRTERICYIKELWDAKVSLESYDFLTLKSKTGGWLKPEELIFPNEYKPEHNIETLMKKGLIDLPLKLVSPLFVMGKNDNEIRKWRAFFGELGVDRIVENRRNNRERNSIIERVAVSTTLLYETKNGRSPKELGQSEQPGYDVESESRNGMRYIEVKGTGDSKRNIFLTVNEFRALQDKDKTEQYFVYVVTDALKNPTLHITLGQRLLEIAPQVIIPFERWRDEAKVGEFRPLAP